MSSGPPVDRTEATPPRKAADLADVVELLLDKGVVINADIAVSVGDTELLGIQVRAAVASFDTAARYGLEFPAGTDEERLHQAIDRDVDTEDELTTKASNPIGVGHPDRQEGTDPDQATLDEPGKAENPESQPRDGESEESAGNTSGGEEDPEGPQDTDDGGEE